jgi:mannose-6-phosphate isomerase-like protein (cupin superfamily)
MKRRLFLKSGLVTPLLVNSPVLPEDDRAKKAVFVTSGSNRVTETFGAGQPNLLKLSGKDTNGDMCIFETTVTQKGGPPLHVHHAVDEWFYVLEGEFVFRIGDETFRLKAGDCILGPRGVPHTLAHVSEGIGKLSIIFQPAGQMEAFFIGSGKRQRRPTAEESQAHFRAHGMEIVGPPLPID